MDMADLIELYKRVNVTVGSNCMISPFCSLENVEIGNNIIIKDGCQLKNVVLGDGTRVARNVTIFSSDEDRPVQVGRYVQVCYGIYVEGTGGKIVIGDYVGLGVMDMIYTSTGGSSFSPIMGELFPLEVGDVIINNHAWLPSRVTVLPGVMLGEGTLIAPHSIVHKGIYDPWTVYGGTPAKFLKRLDTDKVTRAKTNLHYEWQKFGWGLPADKNI
jgi:acetyltransferase-like isoleucine patch superfamily enzyme